MRHKYHPLQSPTSIRLLKLIGCTQHPDSDGNVNVGIWDIIQVDIEREHPSYICISYTWGEGEFTNSVMIKDNTIIMTSENAYEVIIKYKIDEYIWIDQVCINQDDIDERSRQVQLMTRIYAQCARCDAWLGRTDEYFDDACSIAKEISRSFPDSFALADLARLAMRPHQDIRQSLQRNTPPILIPLVDDKRWLALMQFLRRPWFSRLWTFQEAAVPKGLVFRCGHRVLDFVDIHIAAIFSAGGNPWNLDSPGAHLRTQAILVSRDVITYKTKEPFIRLLHRVRNVAYECSDQHDRIYALMGLLSEEMKVSIEVNYRLPVELLYTRAARAMIKKAQSLHILSLKLDPTKSALDNLPSWVLD
ncbi:MAG: hypothetical protein Q9165_006931 [Trypethelium subeluteriae]